MWSRTLQFSLTLADRSKPATLPPKTHSRQVLNGSLASETNHSTLGNRIRFWWQRRGLGTVCQRQRTAESLTTFWQRLKTVIDSVSVKLTHSRSSPFYLILLTIVKCPCNGFYRAMLAQSAVMRLLVVCPSVCLSVCNV